MSEPVPSATEMQRDYEQFKPSLAVSANASRSFLRAVLRVRRPDAEEGK